MELWWVRHGETAYNAEGRWQGQIDVPLNPTGREQVRRLSPLLQSMQQQRPINGVFASDLSRAVETATLLHETPPVLEPRLREMAFGPAEGMTHAELAASGLGPAKGARHPREFGFQGGESFGELTDRVLAFVADLQPGRWLIAAHGGTIRAAVYGLLDEENIWSMSVPNASLTILRYDGGWTCECMGLLPSDDA